MLGVFAEPIAHIRTPHIACTLGQCSLSLVVSRLENPFARWVGGADGTVVG